MITRISNELLLTPGPTNTFDILRTGATVGMSNARAPIVQAISDAASAGGGAVLLPAVPSGSEWKLGVDETPIVIPNNVSIVGAYRGTRIMTYGTADIFQTAAIATTFRMEGLLIIGTNQTGGNILRVHGCERSHIRDVIGVNVLNFLYARQFNVLALHDVWLGGMRGGYAIRAYGDNTYRSDVLQLKNVTVGCDNTQATVGLDWDGNVHTVSVEDFNVVKANVAMQIRNSSGGTNKPAFLFAHNVQSDFALNQAIKIDAGNDMRFSNIYAHGSVNESNIAIASGVSRVRMSQGKVSGAYKCGIDNSGDLEITALDVMDNSQAGTNSYSGIVNRSGASLRVVGGDIYDARHAYGIDNEAGSLQCFVSPETDLSGNATAPFRDTAGNLVTNKETRLTVHSSASGNATWNAMPAADTLLLGASRAITVTDLRKFSQARLVVNVQTPAAFAGSALTLKYNTSGSFTVGNFADVGVSPITLPLGTTNQVLRTQWVNIAQAAKADLVYLAIIGSGGDGTVSPSFGGIYIELR